MTASNNTEYRNIFISERKLSYFPLMTDGMLNENSTFNASDSLGNNGSQCDDVDFEDFYNKAKFVTGLFVYPTVCTFGLVGNVIAVIVFYHSKLKTSTNIYLIALALADGVKLLNDFLYFCVTLIDKYDPKTGKEAFHILYPYSHFIMSYASFLTAWYTISVAAERYIYVCHPALSKSVCTIKRAKIVCVTLCLLMAVLAVPSALRYRVVNVYDNKTQSLVRDLKLTSLWENKNFASCYTWVQNLLRAVIPLVLLIVLNSRIIHSLRKTRANKKLRYRNRISTMLVGVIVVFLICITPDAILSTFGFGYAEGNCLVKGVREISDALLTINSAVNIILYSIFNKLFRLHFMKLFCHESCLNEDSQRELQSFDKVSDTMRMSAQKCTASATLTMRDSAKNMLANNNKLLVVPNGHTYKMLSSSPEEEQTPL